LSISCRSLIAALQLAASVQFAGAAKAGESPIIATIIATPKKTDIFVPDMYYVSYQRIGTIYI
jgi:hypothetical protein